MTRFLLKLDEFASHSRPLWMGLGQLGIVALGIHLAADRLDDHLYRLLLWINGYIGMALSALGAQSVDPERLLTPAAWGALLLELVADGYIFGSLALTAQAPRLSWATWRDRASIQAVVLPLFWAPCALAGAWMVGMAVEDGLADWHGGLARIIGLALSAVVAWRLGWTGWRRIVGGLQQPKHWHTGWQWAPLLLLLAGLAAVHGLPVYGWLS